MEDSKPSPECCLGEEVFRLDASLTQSQLCKRCYVDSKGMKPSINRRVKPTTIRESTIIFSQANPRRRRETGAQTCTAEN